MYLILNGRNSILFNYYSTQRLQPSALKNIRNNFQIDDIKSPADREEEIIAINYLY